MPMLREHKVEKDIYDVDADAAIKVINYSKTKERAIRLAHEITSDTSEHGWNMAQITQLNDADPMTVICHWR